MNFLKCALGVKSWSADSTVSGDFLIATMQHSASPLREEVTNKLQRDPELVWK